VTVGLLDFWVHVLPAGLVAQTTVAFLRRKQFLRPVNARLASWEVMLFAIARWPWILWGSVQGLYAGLRKRDIAFKITPKGDSAAKALPLRYVMPMLFLALAPAIAINTLDGGSAAGYQLLCSVSVVTYLAVAIAIIALHHRDNRQRRRITATPRGSWRARAPLGGSANLAAATTTLAVAALLIDTITR
jgi:hypothetical protein